jgi:hypothetical protein
MAIQYADLVENFQRHPSESLADLKGKFKSKAVRPTDFDMGRLFESIFGWEEFRACRSRARNVVDVFEASGAVSTAAFQAISGQIVFNAILENYTSPAYVFTGLIPTVHTEFSGERVAGIGRVGNEVQVVPENDPYPIAGVSENWIDTAPTQNRGLIVPVSKSAVFFDRTGVLLERCGAVGEEMGLNKELRAIDCVIDENGGAVSAMLGGHRYHWKNTSIATYNDNTGTHTWDNLQATNALVDYSDIENAELLLDAMVSPDASGVITGVYRAAASQVVVTTSLLHTLKQVIHATEIRLHAGGYATSGNLYERAGQNTLQNYEIVSSPLLASRLATDSSWFLGNLGKAFRYMENWPITTTQAPANSHDEFTRDIVTQYKVSERGAYATFDPRYVIKSTA